MLLILLILIIGYVSGETDLTSNETLFEIQLLNEFDYSHESKIIGDRAIFSFTIHNTSYARNILNITSYYFSITFIDEHRHEERTAIANLTDETQHQGQLNMEYLDEAKHGEGGNYFICVFFLKYHRTDLIFGSSRFCHIVSVSDSCKLGAIAKTFTDRHVYILAIFAVVILIIAFIFTCVRNYVYRPKEIEAILKSLPEHHALHLERLTSITDERRRRSTKSQFAYFRRGSVASTDTQPNGFSDIEYDNYHNRGFIPLEEIKESE